MLISSNKSHVVINGVKHDPEWVDMIILELQDAAKTARNYKPPFADILARRKWDGALVHMPAAVFNDGQWVGKGTVLKGDASGVKKGETRNFYIRATSDSPWTVEIL